MSDTIDPPLVHWAAVHTFSVPKEADSLFRYLKVCNGLVLVVEKNYKKRWITKESGKVSYVGIDGYCRNEYPKIYTFLMN